MTQGQGGELMYELTMIRTFSAAHQLRGYRGKCENLHGHNYRVEVKVKAGFLNEIGLAVDFQVLKERTDAVLDTWDHKLLNAIPPFDRINPSAENLAAELYHRLEASCNDLPVTLAAVTVWESDDACATFTE